MVDSLESLGFAPFGVIVAICYFVGFVIKHAAKSSKVTSAIPAIMVVCGAGLGVVMYFSSPEFAATAGEFWWALAIGGVSGVASTGIHQIFKASGSSNGVDNSVTSDNSEVVESSSETGYTTSQTINNAATVDAEPNTDSGISFEDVDPTSGSSGSNAEGFVDIPISQVDPSIPTPEYSSPGEV